MTKSRELRRKFDAAFKREAVQLWEARRATGVPIGRVAKELGLRPNQLREWAGQVAAEPAAERGATAAAAGERPAQAGGRVRKKSSGVLREGVAVRYACIARHRGEYPVRLMCRVLTVAPSGFYTWLTRAPTARAIADERLILNIRVSYDRS